MKSDKKNLDIFAYKVESFDSEIFTEDIVSFSQNSIVFLFNQEGVKTKYKPLDCKIKERVLFFTRIKNPKLYYYLYPIIFLIDYLKIFILFSTISLKNKVKIIIVENTYAAVLAGIMRRLGLFKKMVYLPGDWLAGNNPGKGIFGYIGSNVVFPLFDYFACKFSDLTLNCTELISKARYDYWGKKITKREMLFQVRLKVKSKETNQLIRNKIVFLGGVRRDSGLELVIRSLVSLRKNLDVSLKIIGANSTQYIFLNKISKELNVDKYVEFSGFLERDDLNKGLSDCFCGINILTSKESYSSKTLPAKIFDYFQYLLPVVVTENIGWVAKIILENELGLVIDPDENSFVEAVKKIYERQEQYKKNIIRYINCFKGTGLKELLINLS